MTSGPKLRRTAIKHEIVRLDHALLSFLMRVRRISLTSEISPSIILSQSALSAGLNSLP